MSGSLLNGSPLPARHADKEIHALVVFAAMHHAGELEIGLVELESDLLAGFADASGQHGLIAIQMAGRDAVFAVAIAGGLSAGNQDCVAAKEEEMDGGRKPGAH